MTKQAFIHSKAKHSSVFVVARLVFIFSMWLSGVYVLWTFATRGSSGRIKTGINLYRLFCAPCE